jgi:hypothetical protein
MRLNLAVGSMWFYAFLSYYLRTGSDPASMSLCSSWNIKSYYKEKSRFVWKVGLLSSYMALIHTWEENTGVKI